MVLIRKIGGISIMLAALLANGAYPKPAADQAHSFTRGGNVSFKKSLNYHAFSFEAPNLPERPYYVFAAKNGKIIWEIHKENLKPSGGKSAGLKTGGIEALSIQTVRDSDLDHGVDQYLQMQAYVGKPALRIDYTKDSTINQLPSWALVDLLTGKTIAVIAFN